MRNATSAHGARNFQSNKPAMYKAICDECGVTCEVPFKPSGDKPIFCSNCFADKRPDSSHRGDNFNKRNDSRKQSFGDKEMFKAVCDKCGVNCEVPFKPSGDKPVYCNNCFGKGGNKQNGNRGDNKPSGAMSKSSENLNSKFEMLNAKVDKIMAALNINTDHKKEQLQTPKKNDIAEKEEIKVLSKKIAKKSVDKAIKKAASAAARPKTKSRAKVSVKPVAKKKVVAKKKK